MATNKKEVLVSIKTNLDTASAQSTAKELQQIIGKSGISKEAKDAAAKYLAEFEKAAKAMDAITSKGQIGTADYKSLNQYFKMMRDNYAKISEIAKETLDLEPAALTSLRESINKKVSAGEQEIRQRKVQFKGQAKAAVGKGISFEDAKDELTYLNSYIASLEQEKQKIYNETIGVATKQIEEIVSVDRKANGQKFKNLEDYKRYYETKQKEIARLTKDLENPNLGEEGRANKIAQLNSLTEAQLKRTETLRVINTLEEQEATSQERAAVATAKQTKEIADNTTKRDKLQTVLQETENDINTIIDSVNAQTEAERLQLKVEEDLYATQKKQAETDIQGLNVTGQENFNQAAGNIASAGNELAKLKGVQEAVGKGFDNMTNRLKGFISGTYLLGQAFNKLKQASQIVTNLDNEITQIAIVTKQTTSEVWDSFQTFNQAAMQLSTTTRQYLEGAKIFYQQGLNTAEVMSMVEATTMAAALSGVSFRDASETLTAAINGYNMAASKAGEVTDKFAAVGAASAADFQELSTAMEKVASQAYSSGMSFDSLLGILAKGIETTREAPEAIGTGLKSIIARFQEMKENPMATLEDGVDANRVEKALKSVGVALRDTNGEFRNMDEVFADLGEAWKTMSRNQRAYIATMAAGSRQQSRFMAIMNDYDRTLQLVRTSTNSAGEASAQYAIYEESVAAAQQRLQNSFEQMSTSIMSSDFLRWLYDFSATFLSGLSKINPLVLTLGTSFSVLAGKITFMSSAAKIAQAGDLVSTKNMGFLTKKIAERLVGTEALTGGIVKQTVAQTALTVATVAYVAAAVAAIAIIVLLIKARNDEKNAIHELAAENRKNAEDAKSQYSALQTQVDRYEELSKTVNRTKEQQAEYNDIIKQIADSNPNLVAGIDHEGNIRLKNIDIIREETKELQKQARIKDLIAYQTELESKAQADWNATLAEGGAGAGSVAAAQDLQNAFDNVDKELGDINDKFGTGLSTIFDAGELKKTIIKYLEEGTKINRTDQEEVVKTLVERTLGVGYDPSTEVAKQLSNVYRNIYSKAATFQEKQLADSRSFVSKGLFAIGQDTLDTLEAQGIEISNQYRDIVAGFSYYAVSMAEEAGKTDIKGISEFAIKIQDELMGSLSQLQNIPGFNAQLEEFFDLKQSGKTIKEIESNYKLFVEKIGISGTELEKALRVQLIDEEAFRDRMESIANIFKIDPKIFETTNLGNSLSEFFKSFSESANASIFNAINNLETDKQKQEFLNAIQTVFSNKDLKKQFEEQLLTGFTDPTMLKDLTSKMQIAFENAGVKSPTYVSQFIESLIENSNITLDRFLENAKTASDKLKELQKLIEKPMDLTEAINAGQKYGMENIIQTGQGQFTFDPRYIIEQRIESQNKELEIVNKMISDLERKKEILSNIDGVQISILDNIQSQIDGYKNMKTEIEGVQEEEKNRLIDPLFEQMTLIDIRNEKIKDFGEIINKLDAGKVFTTGEIKDYIDKHKELRSAVKFVNGEYIFQKQLVIDVAEAAIASSGLAIDQQLELLKTNIDTTRAYIAGVEAKQIAEIDFSKTLDAAAAQEAYDRALKAKEDADIAVKEAQNAKVRVQNNFQIASSSLNIARANLAQLKTQAALDPMRYKAEYESAQKAVTSYEGTIKNYSKDMMDATNNIASAEKNLADKTSALEEAGKALKNAQIKQAFLDLGIDPTTVNKNFKSVLDTLTQLEDRYNEGVDAATKQKAKSLYDILKDSVGDSAKDAKESVDKLTDSFEKYYNELKKIEQLESNLDEVQSRIDLRATGAKEDLSLLKEKAGTIKQLISSQEDLNSKRIDELKSMEAQLGLYRGFVTIENGLAVVRQQELFMQLQAGLVTQERYDAVVQYVQSFNELSSAIDETTSSIIDLQAQQEQMYDELIQNAIDTRQQIYDALVESDQREIDELTQKYDTMKQLEDDYLSAVKNAIDEERKAREDSAKAEDLLQKQRRLAILQRDTSGLYATEAAQLQEQIAKDQQDARDAEVDKQMAALEKQIALQQEQRDTQVKLLEDQKLFREETGYYWDRVDNAIQNGPQAMLDLLTSSQEYQTADPLAQQRQLEEFQSAVDTLNELAQGAGSYGVINQIIESANAIISNRMSEMASQNESQKKKPSGGQEQQQQPTGGTYTVKKGDTLTGIAARLGVPYPTIQAKNQWIKKRKSWDYILPGDQIAYKDGGYVKHTGPAWVDGTSGSPEAFLNARQTAIFESLRDYLASPTSSNMLGSGNVSNSTSIGDIIINLQNATGASPKDIADQVKKELTNIMVTKNTLSIQKVR